MHSELDIKVGTPVQYQVEGVAERLTGSFVGMDEHSFILSLPTAALLEKHGDSFAAGKPIVVRYIYEGKAFGFQSTIVGAISEPAKLVFVDYPEDVEHIPLRRAKRIECQLPGKVISERGIVSGVVIDISRGGCRVALRVAAGAQEPFVAVDDRIKMSLLLPGVEGEVLLPAIVRSVAEEVERLACGIQFDRDEAGGTDNVYHLLLEYLRGVEG